MFLLLTQNVGDGEEIRTRLSFDFGTIVLGKGKVGVYLLCPLPKLI